MRRSAPWSHPILIGMSHAMCLFRNIKISPNPPEPAGTRGGTRQKTQRGLSDIRFWSEGEDPEPAGTRSGTRGFWEMSHAIWPFHGVTPGLYYITIKERCEAIFCGLGACRSLAWRLPGGSLDF